MLQMFLHPCSFSLFFSSLKRIKDPEGKWFAGFPAEPQMCWLGAALGASWGSAQGQTLLMISEGLRGTLLGGLSFAGKLLLISS